MLDVTFQYTTYNFFSHRSYLTIDYMYITFSVTFHVVWKISQSWAIYTIEHLKKTNNVSTFLSSAQLTSTVHALINNNYYTLCHCRIIIIQYNKHTFWQVAGKTLKLCSWKTSILHEIVLDNVQSCDQKSFLLNQGMKSFLQSMINFIRKCLVSITYTFSRVLKCHMYI